MSNEISKQTRIYVAGHRGMVGSALVRQLTARGYHNIIVYPHESLDLTRQSDVEYFFQQEKPDVVFLAAAKVGGIYANNTFRAEFIYENLMIEANVIHSAWKAGVNNLLYLGSSCIYPRECPQPIKEAYLLTGPLEETNEPYAIAKIAGIKLCENYNRQYGTHYISVMPTNLYGPNDNYDLTTSHVLPALIRKVHEAKQKNQQEIVLWGSGKPKREFLYVDDMADACIFLMESTVQDTLFNIGVGEDLSIYDLAMLIMEVIGFQGKITFDATKPDGTPRKLLNIDRIRQLGWNAKVSLREGIALAYRDYVLKSNG